MKKYILLIFLLSATVFAQSACKLTVDSKTGKPMLVGKLDRQAFLDSNFAAWFNMQYNFYKPDTQVIKLIAPKLKDKKIEIVMGTWCSDSRREVPRLFKIFDLAKVPPKNIEVIAVSRKMKAPAHLTDSLSIERVPTVIVYNGKKEMGRIIETPVETLEKDLENIVDKK